jgi:hypothetical protein
MLRAQSAKVVLPVCLLLAGGTTAFAQWSRFDNPRQDYVRSDQALFAQARADLDRASRYSWASRSDTKRFDEARSHLFNFESRFDQGRYEKHELDEAISHIQSVVDHNSLDPRDRGALGEDLRRMRDYRAYREHGPAY